MLFVPLYRFRLGADLKPSLGEFAKAELGYDVSLFDKQDDAPILFVFDGLDELAQRGKVGEELAADFFRQVDDFVKDCNRDSGAAHVKVMLCGRPVAVSNTNAEVRKAGRVRYLLPYKIDDAIYHEVKWKGPSKFLQVDQRDEWWAKFGAAIGDPEMTEMPSDIRTPKLDPLTAEPILNGLVAECRRNHRITPETNRAQIYEWLLLDVLRRVHDKSGKQHLKDAKEDDIALLLEEVAVTAWHNGDVRATTKTMVRERCERTEQTDLLNRVFPDQEKSSISSLFLAFYFQEAGERRGQDRAFEFSHKSFGEYLLARRIVRFIRELCMRLENGAWDGEVGLKRWGELFGPTSLDEDLWNFVQDLMELESIEVVNAWRSSIVRLFNRLSKHGMPMHQVGLATFQQMEKHARNAILALFAIHSACFRSGQDVIQAELVSGKSVICEVLSQQMGPSVWQYDISQSVSMYLRGLDLRGLDLFMGSLAWGDFDGADLSRAELTACNLVRASFEGTKLTGARLGGVTLGGPSRRNEMVIETDLRRSSLSHAQLDGADFGLVRLEGADLTGADLSQSNITPKQLGVTAGKPAVMPNGRPPKRRKRVKASPKTRDGSGSGS